MANELIAGRYRLRELLGSGPMSEVWAADDEDLERRVALKLLAPDADRARFAREARAAAALAHPHIVQLFDYGEAEGRPYMVLEYLPGGTLEERLHPGVLLADDETHRIASEIASGLAHAHSRGLVHRDLKPANILFDAEARAKIGDFGIARLGGSGTLTEAGTVLGTASYISPEQAAGETATSASDVYSFGVILYRLLAGRLPFEAAQPMELLQLHLSVPPPSLDVVRPDAPAALAALAADALAKDPAARPQDGAAVLERLGAPIAPAPVTRAAATATQVLQTPPRRARRRRPPAAALAAIVALLAAGGAALAYAVTRPTGAQAPTTATFRTEVGHRTLPKLKTTASTRAATTASLVTTAATTRATTTAATTRAHTTQGTTTFTLPPTTAPPPTTEATTTIATTTATTTTTAFGTTTAAFGTTTAAFGTTTSG